MTNDSTSEAKTQAAGERFVSHSCSVGDLYLAHKYKLEVHGGTQVQLVFACSVYCMLQS